MGFLPQDEGACKKIREHIAKLAGELGLRVIAWRSVPYDASCLGPTAQACQPTIEQVFVESVPGIQDSISLEKKAWLLDRKSIFDIDNLDLGVELFGAPALHWASFCTRTIVYKLQGLSTQVRKFFVEMQSEELISDFALVHSRFSTNTFPSWSRAQPLSRLAHNGEINTLVGNQKWNYSRHNSINFEALGIAGVDAAEFLRPSSGLSDSGVFNAVLEQLIACGRSIQEVMMIMVPEAWQNDDQMPQNKRDYYEYMSCLMEPWDGPACLCYCDGNFLGATLDRSGLRPGKFVELSDGRFILASEYGVVDVDPAMVVRKGRLSPGRMVLLDLKNHRVLEDGELKDHFANQKPYGEWVKNQVVDLNNLPAGKEVPVPKEPLALEGGVEAIVPELARFGWSLEAVDVLFIPMLATGMEALGSMGNDSPLAVLRKAPLVFDFFKQLFAQVTNPPLDSSRESCVMSLECMVGPEGDVSQTTEAQANRLRLKSPIISLEQMASMASINYRGWTSVTLDMTFSQSGGPEALGLALTRLTNEATQAVADGHKIIILSDVGVSEDKIPIATLMAVGAVHQHLVKTGSRLKVALLTNSGEAREVHHFCSLVGFGADGVCPRIALEMVGRLRGNVHLKKQDDGSLPTGASLQNQYINAIHYGMLKVMAKMGISTLQSYKGAQIFEAIGLAKDVMDLCFTGTPSRIGGLNLMQLANLQIAQHVAALPVISKPNAQVLPNVGQYHYRSNQGSDVHLNDPLSISKLQDAARTNSPKAYADYSRMINDLNKKTTIRGLLKFKESATPISIDEVEPASEIVKRFCTGAMSYGSISIEAHETLALAMNAMGGKSNSGEGGEAVERYALLPNGDKNPRRSAIKQIASGRFGVTSDYLTSATELQIKMAQGAKPGEGGELGGNKVIGDIAKVRMATPGVGLISPPPHHDIYSIEDLKELIFNLKNSNPTARVSVKLVSEVGVGTVAAGVAKGLADHILISGHDGGTGAARWTGVKHCGLPWELGLAEAQQTLVMNDLRKKVVVQTDGQLKTGRDIVVAALLGAEEFGFATAPLIAMGCIMMRKCHLNTCPVGIATQDPELRKKFKGTPEHVQNFLFMLAEEARTYMAQMGFKSIAEMVGRSDMLEQDQALFDADDGFLKGIDLSSMLKPAHVLRKDADCSCTEKQEHGLATVLDAKLVEQCADVLTDLSEEVYIEMPVTNVDRAVGCMLSHELTKAVGYGNKLRDDAIHLKFEGSSGQALGCWLASGITIELEGDANDFVAKGLCGGRVIVYPPKVSSFVARDNEIVGNVALYGATSGQAFMAGRAGERFCVRNSGAEAVIEGCGDHGLEYMTGGRAVILGSMGKNVGAGMSGGIGYVYDPNNELPPKVNMGMVNIGPVVRESDVKELKRLLQLHRKYTRSKIAGEILGNWEVALKSFVRVMPEAFRVIYEAEADSKMKTKPATKAIKPAAPVVQKESPPAKEEERTKAAADIEDSLMSKLNIGGGSLKETRPATTAGAVKRRGFISYARGVIGYRPAEERLGDWKEIAAVTEVEEKKELLTTQAARCMDCGVPFCHQTNSGCPLGNRIPEWNEYVFNGQWKQAYFALAATNNFPEFTGRVCPAPCEGACVLGIIESPVSIKNIECSIIDRAFAEGWVVPTPPAVRSGKKVAIIGSGPAGLAAADMLNRAGHLVTVYERDDRVGGLMMYGVPNMKSDKEDIVGRRVKLLADEGITFVTNTAVGKDVTISELRAGSDALLLATGATLPRDLPIEGRKLNGVHFAMEFLKKNTKALLDKDDAGKIDVKGKQVVVIGGGDTGNDCIGTSMRQGATSVVNFELLPQPPAERAPDNPWPQWPRIYRIDYGHEEVKTKYGEDPREYCVLSKRFLDDGKGNLIGVETIRVEWTNDAGRWSMKEMAGTEKVFDCSYVFLAMGFLGPELGVSDGLNLELDGRKNFKAEMGKHACSEEGVFAAGDCRRGQSLVVWAIAEGRAAAESVDNYLM
jgi:glutamate synthase (NADPH/NADH)